ncbi:MAG: DUF3040 domain-containing protein [Actinobacteria bacterium]|nr:DUF3040 domain-containing protein [Actinomycetota bacterium]
MPLSEEEQRVLREIERSFYENDPEFARQVSSKTLYRHAGRNLRWAALGFIAGLVVLVASFASYLILGILGFLGMLFSALIFERNLRAMGKAGLQSISENVRSRGGMGGLDDAKRRFRQRFQR